MGGKKESHKGSGICFDSMNLAELTKLMGKSGIGSLCREMMETAVRTGKGKSLCVQFMEKMATEQRKTGEIPENEREQSSPDSKENRGRGQ